MSKRDMSRVDAGALLQLAHMGNVSPSQFGHALIESRVLVKRSARLRLSNQGAGLMGGTVLSRLRDAGLATTSGGWLYMASPMGRKLASRYGDDMEGLIEVVRGLSRG
jgi:hypothetical protein